LGRWVWGYRACKFDALCFWVASVGDRRKRFFFEKKNQKTFATGGVAAIGACASRHAQPGGSIAVDRELLFRPRGAGQDQQPGMSMLMPAADDAAAAFCQIAKVFCFFSTEKKYFSLLRLN
jgi:hypothetical protein